MKKICKLTVFALLLTGVSLAQQEVSPDRFEGEAAKQPVKVKRVVKNNQTSAHVAQKHHSSKSASKTVAMARVAGN